MPNISRNPATPEEKIANGVPTAAVPSCRSSSTGNAEGEDGKQALQNHSSVSDFLHIFSFAMVFEEVPDDTRLWNPETAPQATVTNRIGNRSPDAALWKPVYIGRFIFGCAINKSDNSAKDHAGKHKGCHKVTRLHQKPHRKDSGKKDVGKYQISPGCFACYKRYIHADCKG